jgi:hypothetical protein
MDYTKVRRGDRGYLPTLKIQTVLDVRDIAHLINVLDTCKVGYKTWSDLIRVCCYDIIRQDPLPDMSVEEAVDFIEGKGLSLDQMKEGRQGIKMAMGRERTTEGGGIVLSEEDKKLMNIPGFKLATPDTKIDGEMEEFKKKIEAGEFDNDSNEGDSPPIHKIDDID